MFYSRPVAAQVAPYHVLLANLELYDADGTGVAHIGGYLTRRPAHFRL